MFRLSTAAVLPLCASAASVTLYDQDSEAPASYINKGDDHNFPDSVNASYGNQPVGFVFSQNFTVETLNVSGSERGNGRAAFVAGYSDPSGTGGDFPLGLLAGDRGVQNDLLGLSFDVGSFAFFNVGVDISSIDLSDPRFNSGNGFVLKGSVTVFRFSLFDNYTGASNFGVGRGMALSSFELTGTASARDTFDWTRGSFGLSTAGNTNGKATLQIDLLAGGGYAAFDNLLITAADAAPPVGAVPLPAGLPLLAGGLLLLGSLRRRRKA